MVLKAITFTLIEIFHCYNYYDITDIETVLLL